MIVLLVSTSLFSYAQEDTYIGLFTNIETGLSVTVTKNTNNYTGKLEAPGQSYAFTGTRLLGVLVGSYTYNGATATFTLSKMGANYFVTSDGITLEVKRQITKTLPPKANSEQQVAKSAPLTTTTPQTNGAKANGSKYADAFGAYTFNGPDGWKMQQENGSFGFSKIGQQAVITVTPHNYNNLNEVRNEAKDVQEPQNNTILKVQFEAYSNTGAWVIFRGTIQNQAYTIATIALISPYGGGVNITAVSPTHAYNNALVDILRSVSNTVVFTKAKTSPLATQWKDKLKGKELLYLNTSNGLSDKLSIYLCANGQFYKKDDSSYSSSGFTNDFNYAGRSNDNGRWDISMRNNTPLLALRADNGQTYTYEISLRQATNELGLNGKRYFVRTSQQCP